MAMEHFNARNGTITPELEELQDCNIQFDLEHSMFLDTGSVGHMGNNLVYELAQTRNFPLCALVGPYNNMPAESIALLAAASATPHIPIQGYSIRLSNPDISPMTANINPDIVLTGEAVASYLVHIQRDNYVAILHPTTEFGAQAKESMTVAFNKRGMEQFQVYGYLPPMVTDTYGSNSFLRIPAVLERVKERGFRTILVSLDVFFTDLAALADAANALKMLNGEYVWVFMPLFEAEAIHNAMQLPESFLASQGIPSFGNVSNLLRGAALIRPVDKYQTMNHSDDEGTSFLNVWKQQDADFVQRVNDAYVNKTIHMGPEDGFLMLPDFFQTYSPEPATATIYDSIMAVGIGACHAQEKSNSSKSNFTIPILGQDHKDSIISLDFHGANGRVLFGDPLSNFSNLKVRTPTTVTFGVWNMYPPSDNATEFTSFDDAFVLTEIETELGGPYAPSGTPAAEGKWTQLGPRFVFANGQITPPELLRDVSLDADKSALVAYTFSLTP